MPTAEDVLLERVAPVAGFTESDPHGDPLALRERLRADGYLFLRGLLPRERVLRVRRAILALCRDHGWLAAGSDFMDGIAKPGLVVLDNQPEWARLYVPLIRNGIFNALSTSTEVISFFERVLGGDVLAHPRNIARIIFPGSTSYTTQPHQDWPHIQGTPDTYTMWSPLGDCPRRLGGLAVLEGSSVLGEQPHVPAVGAGGIGVRCAGLGLRWLFSDYAIGDVVIFHSHTIHSGLDHQDPRLLRLSTDFRYQRADLPVHESSYLPHGYGWLEKIAKTED